MKTQPDKLGLVAFMAKTGNLWYHAAHNTVSTCAFHADHAFYGEAYAAFDAAYDDLIERQIGLTGSADIVGVNTSALEAFAKLSLDTDSLVETAMELERDFISAIEGAMGISTGTDDLLAGLANAAEVRLYKLRQRNV